MPTHINSSLDHLKNASECTHVSFSLLSDISTKAFDQISSLIFLRCRRLRWKNLLDRWIPTVNSNSHADLGDSIKPLYDDQSDTETFRPKQSQRRGIRTRITASRQSSGCVPLSPTDQPNFCCENCPNCSGNVCFPWVISIIISSKPLLID